MGKRGTPRERLKDQAEWPRGETNDLAVRRAQEMAQRLLSIQEEGMSLRKMADSAGVSVSTVHRITTGMVWPDLHVVTALEQALNVALVPEYRSKDARDA